jgi:hypothetical protein
MGRGQRSDRAASQSRAGRERPDIEGELGLTHIDEALLDEHVPRTSDAYQDLARRYKQVADQAFVEYRRATDLWVLCEQKATAARRGERRSARLTGFDEAMTIG